MISTAIITLLSGVGDFYPMRVTQTAKAPFITFHIASCECQGNKINPNFMDIYRVQFNIFSEQYADLNTKDAAIRAILSGYSGTVGTVVIDSARIESRFDSFFNGAEYYCRVLDYVIRVKV